MAALSRCPSCDGFVPDSARVCPHCGATEASLRSRVGFWLKAAGGGAVAVTMMACYGVPPEPGPDDDSTTSETDEGTASEEGTSAAMMDEDHQAPAELRADEARDEARGPAPVRVELADEPRP